MGGRRGGGEQGLLLNVMILRYIQMMDPFLNEILEWQLFIHFPKSPYLKTFHYPLRYLVDKNHVMCQDL